MCDIITELRIEILKKIYTCHTYRCDFREMRNSLREIIQICRRYNLKEETVFELTAPTAQRETITEIYRLYC
jgi:hypothetical protein